MRDKIKYLLSLPPEIIQFNNTTTMHTTTFYLERLLNIMNIFPCENSFDFIM